MKNPNHYGTITKLSGARRKPWMVREGMSGKQRPIGYAETREEALILLAKYNQRPWDVDTERTTLQELFELWLEKRAVKLGTKNRQKLKSAYKHIATLDEMRYSQINAYQMQECVDNCGHGSSTKATIRNLWRHLDKFALELNVILKANSDLLDSIAIQESSKEPFTDEEVDRCWEHENEPWVDSVLFLLYTGFRITEMRELRIEDIDLHAWTMVGGIKTQAGKNRVVPVHSKIQSIVQRRFEQSKSGFLFEHNGRQVYESFFREQWAKVMKSLGMKHTPHECRHTLRSRLDSAGANKVCIDRIIGHKSAGVGERVYTHKTIEELRANLELVTN